MEKENYVGEGVKLSSITEMMSKSAKVVCLGLAGIMLVGGLAGCNFNKEEVTQVQEPEIVQMYQSAITPKIYNKTFAQCYKAVDAFLLQKGEITKLKASDNGTIKLYDDVMHQDGFKNSFVEVNIKDIKLPLKILPDGDRDRVSVEYKTEGSLTNHFYLNRADIVSSTIKNDSKSFYSAEDGCDLYLKIPLQVRSSKMGLDENGVPNERVSPDYIKKFGGKEGAINKIKEMRNDSRDFNLIVDTPTPAFRYDSRMN